MSAFWAWSSEALAPGERLLPPEEARHVAARRLRPGDALIVFDGRGRTATARLEGAGKRGATVHLETVEETPRPDSDFVIASAVPKGDRLSTMLQMLTQLGAPTWQPLVLEHSVVRRLDPEAPRIQRILVESAKVARRPWLLEVRPPTPLEDVVADSAPGTACFGDRAGAAGTLPPDCGLVLIGPEAGFSDAERGRLVAEGVRPVAFAPHNLRIETAAIAAAVAHFAGRPSPQGERA